MGKAVFKSFDEFFKYNNPKVSFEEEIRAFLESKGIKSVWHFTDMSNLQSILDHGLMSLNALESEKIEVRHYGADSLSHSLDHIFNLDKYVHLSFVSDHPMYHVAKDRGSIVNPVWLEVDLSVIFESTTLFTNAVANATGTVPFQAKDLREKIDFDAMLHSDFDIRKEAKKAEILVRDRIDPDKIIGGRHGR